MLQKIYKSTFKDWTVCYDIDYSARKDILKVEKISKEDADFEKTPLMQQITIKENNVIFYRRRNWKRTDWKRTDWKK